MEDKLDSILRQERTGQRMNQALSELIERINLDNTRDEERRFKFDFTPRELYDEVAKYVIGQEQAIQRVSNAVCYHYQGLSKGNESGKSNVLLIGPTGCGKTYIVEKFSQLIDVPLLISDATKFSATGYVGDKVENLVQDLVSKSNGDLALASRGIIYIDEIDKLAARDGFGRDVSGRDVQNGLLKILEGGDVKVVAKDGEKLLNTKNILFIAGGAFSDLYKGLRKDSSQIGFSSSRAKELDNGEVLNEARADELITALQKYGMIPELLGRIPVIARLNQLSKDDLVRILKESKESPIKAYQKDFEAYGIKANFTEGAYDTIAQLAFERGIGARGLRSVIEESLTAFKFYLPDLNLKEVVFSENAILKPEESLVNLLNSQTKFYGGKNGSKKKSRKSSRKQ